MFFEKNGKVIMESVSLMTGDELLALPVVLKRGLNGFDGVTDLGGALERLGADKGLVVSGRAETHLLVEFKPGRVANLSHLLWALNPRPDVAYNAMSGTLTASVSTFKVEHTGWGEIIAVVDCDVDDYLPAQAGRVVARRAA